MESAIFTCPAAWEPLLPPGVRPLHRPGEATGCWEVLALTPEGAALAEKARCGLLLVPGDGRFSHVQACRVVTYGLSPRDTLTLSSLTEPVLCVQRALPRPDGDTIEPQEFPLPPLPFPAVELLPLLGLRLLRMPLTEPPFSW